jgi:hypothetical protein
LSLTQRIVLTILSEAQASIGRVFAAMANGRETLVFMGDIGVLGSIEKMAVTNPPVLTIGPGEKPFQRVASITATGRQVLAGTVDYLSLKAGERWVGGVRIAEEQPSWRLAEAADGRRTLKFQT